MKRPVRLIFILFFILMTSDVFAHKVIVFAWVEEGMIHIQGSFGSNKKAKNCEINILDENNIRIHTGQTDLEGKYSLKVPSAIASDLTIILNAGSGHKGSWTILKTEILADQAMVKSLDTNQDVIDKKDVIDQKDAGQKGINQDKVKEKIKDLEKDPSMGKILTGIGIIFGLAMLITIIKKTKKNS